MHKKRTEKGAYRMRNLFPHTIRPFFDVSFFRKICRKVSFVLEYFRIIQKKQKFL